MNDVQKYARGSIWWYNENNTSPVPGKQFGSRPCVIVSNNNRGNSDIVTIAKMTSNFEKSHSVNVKIFFNGKENLILCNQLETVSTTQLNSFQGVVSDEIMQKINSAMLLVLGMPELIHLEEKFEDLRTLVQQIDDMTLQDYQYSRIDVGSEIQKVVDGLTKMISSAQTNLVKSAKDIETKKVRKKWTNDLMRQFIKDKESLPLSQVVEKYDLTSAQAAYQYYYTFKKRLANG